MNAPRLATRRGFSICLSCRRNFMRQLSSTPAPFNSFQAYPLPQQPNGAIARPIQFPSPKAREMRPIGEATLEVPRRSPSPPTPAREEKAQTSKRDVAAAPSAPSTPAATQASPTTSPPISPTETPPLAKAPAPAEAATPAPKPRSKLRTPRKAAIKLTPSAVEQLRALLDQPSPKLIKVGVRNRGCSGLSYSLEFVDKAGKFDETVEQDGVQVLIDSKALFSIIGSEMDWVEDKLSQKFVFRNPNIKEECGCGESFMV